jgi:hypothetical protein
MKLAVASVIVLGLGLVSPGMAPAFAQSSGLGPEYKEFSPPDVVEEKQQPFTIVELSDNDLRSYAQAMVVIMGIDDYYQQEFESAATEQEQETIAGEALGRMAQALDDEGISFKKYQEITAVAQQHPKIRSRIVAHMKDLTGIEE